MPPDAVAVPSEPTGQVEAAAAPATPAAPRLPAGWRTVAAKEFTDHLLSVRFVVLLLLVGLTAVATVYAAAGAIRDVAPDATGAPALFLRLFTVAPERIPAFFALVGFLAPLLGIAFGFDAVNGERAQGTLPRLLSQPIHRDDVINGKFAAGLAAIALVLAVLTLTVAGVALLRLGIVPTGGDAARLTGYYVVTVLYVGFWLGFATLCSVVLRRAATSALVAIATWLVLTLFASILVGLLADAVAPVPANATADEVIRHAQVQQTLARVSPTTLYQEATVAVLNPQVRTVGLLLPAQLDRAIPSSLPLDQSLLLVWPQAVGLVALTVVTFAAGYILFLRQEVRA